MRATKRGQIWSLLYSEASSSHTVRSGKKTSKNMVLHTSHTHSCGLMIFFCDTLLWFWSNHRKESDKKEKGCRTSRDSSYFSLSLKSNNWQTLSCHTVFYLRTSSACIKMDTVIRTHLWQSWRYCYVSSWDAFPAVTLRPFKKPLIKSKWLIIM